MHLEGPWLTTTGKQKGKKKWASAEQKRQHEELERQWQQNIQKWNSMTKKSVFKPSNKSTEALRPRIPPGRSTTQNIPSVDSGHVGAVMSKPSPVYTGTKIIGIGTMHKSNAVPIFSEEQAHDISKMRRG
jgi:hypothetical protein